MATTMISAASAGAPWAWRSKAVDSWTSSELVKAFGHRVFSIARHITQNDDDAGDVLIETFLEACSDWDECRAEETLWIRLVAVAVRKAFSKLRERGEGRPLDADVSESAEEMVAREFFAWGDHSQPCDSRSDTASVFENGLRSLDLMARTIFVLRDIERISVEHIAGIVNRSVAAVEVCLLRAHFQLGEVLGGQMKQKQ